MINYIYYSLIGIICFYNYLHFNHNIARDNYAGSKSILFWILELLGINCIFTIIDKYFYKISIVSNIKFSSIFLIILLIGLYIGFRLFSVGNRKNNDRLRFEDK